MTVKCEATSRDAGRPATAPIAAVATGTAASTSPTDEKRLSAKTFPPSPWVMEFLGGRPVGPPKFILSLAGSALATEAVGEALTPPGASFFSLSSTSRALVSRTSAFLLPPTEPPPPSCSRTSGQRKRSASFSVATDFLRPPELGEPPAIVKSSPPTTTGRPLILPCASVKFAGV